MARIFPAVTAVTLACALAGCSSSPTTSEPGSTASTPTATSGSAPTVTSGSAGGGSADCSALSGDNAATYSFGIQFLAQLRNQATVDLVKDGTANYDPDALGAVLESLKGLPKGALGDPGPDIDFYIKANDKAKAILAVDGPVPQSMFDDLIAFEGDTGAFISRQASITAAYSDACD